MTAALREQKDLSLPAPKMVIHNMLREGEVPCEFIDEGDGRVFVPTQLLADARRISEGDLRSLGDALAVLAGEGAVSERKRIGEGKRYRGFVLPTLAECRVRWEEHLGRAVEWPQRATDWAGAPF